MQNRLPLGFDFLSFSDICLTFTILTQYSLPRGSHTMLISGTHIYAASLAHIFAQEDIYVVGHWPDYSRSKMQARHPLAVATVDQCHYEAQCEYMTRRAFH